ncbi:f9461da5-e8b5-4ada-91a5-4e4e8a02c652 [Thermothielavioides terrestris]|nr:f9461da5-e8b5-4ada-91a5-4e4e8a02c652 [Thermothielavioides terrestris]
MTEYKQA